MRKLILILILLFIALPVLSATEDFTTYTEVDTGTNITVTSTRVTHDSDFNIDEYVYYNKGINHFSDFEHLVTVHLTSAPSNRIKGMWCLTNDIDDIQGLWDNNKTGIYVLMGDVGAEKRIYISESYSGLEYYDFFSCSVETLYYLKVEKTGTTFTCKIYSDSSRTTLLDTLSLTLHSNHTLRYIFVTNSRNEGAGGQNVVSYTENLDLQEAAAAEPEMEVYIIEEL